MEVSLETKNPDKKLKYSTKEGGQESKRSSSVLKKSDGATDKGGKKKDSAGD